MKRNLYKRIENYMKTCMKDSAHDKEHIYRVLYAALDIASYEKDVNEDVIIISSLLHDIGRGKQYEDSKLCHAIVGGEMAYEFLIKEGLNKEDSIHVKDCIQSHRYRTNMEPKTIEAKILFDADKLDSTGTMGIARTLLYCGIISRPLYLVCEDGRVLDGTNEQSGSFFSEYHFKLKKLYDKFYTKRAEDLAKERIKAFNDFYKSMLSELNTNYLSGIDRLNKLLD